MKEQKNLIEKLNHLKMIKKTKMINLIKNDKLKLNPQCIYIKKGIVKEDYQEVQI